MFVIEEELKKLPDQPGVYIMHDSRDAIIYIGKAVSLRKRVHQYFQPSHDEGIKKAQMVKQIARFEYIVTDSELEALVLECNLIKEHRPKYNTMLRDDKTYPYIRVTLGEDFPRVLFSRQQKKDKSRYFRPLHERGSSQGYDRAGEQDLSAAHLQPEPAARHGEGPPVSELSYSSVHGALPGIYHKGSVP